MRRSCRYPSGTPLEFFERPDVRARQRRERWRRTWFSVLLYGAGVASGVAAVVLTARP